jgi:hypothetical protein
MTFDHHGLRVLIVAVIVPALITIAAEIVLLSLAASGPARLATHWGFSDQPDGYGSAYTYPILMAAIALPLIALLGGGSVVLAHRAPMSPVMKIAAVASTWMSSFLGTLFIWGLLTQRTVAEVDTARSPGWEILAGVIVGLALATGGWFVLPKVVRRSADSEPAATPAVSLADGERASWQRTASASRGVLAVFIGLTLVIGATQLLVVEVSDGRAWWVSFVPVLLLLLVLTNFTWTVRVDARGVRLRSVVGVPVITIPIGNVIEATVVQVSPLAEFGGYGIRWNLNKRLGIILRSGEALEIRRRKGIDVVVTVDDATTAAALLNALVARESAAAG